MPELLDFPLPRTDPMAPPPAYSILREGPPRQVRLAHGSTPWLLTRYADVQAALVDPRLSADSRNPGLPQVVPLPPGPSRVSFLRMDDPEHGKLRRMLTPEFSLRRIQALRLGIERTVNELVDGMLRQGPPVDLIDVLALPLPSLVICELLGVPYEDHEFFQAKSKVIASAADSPESVVEAYAQMSIYLDGLVTTKEQDPGDDLLGRAVRDYVATGELAHEELVAMTRLLLIAGHDTTANMLGLAVLTLLRTPDQMELLRAGPKRLPAAVDELMRFLSISQAGMVRVVTGDVEIGGQQLLTGDGVLFALPAANHDEQAFADAGRFDIGRDAHRHLGFGFGAHQCLGRSLAKLELEVALGTVLRRLPDLRLAVDLDELRFRQDSFVYGVEKLPVRW